VVAWDLSRVHQPPFEVDERLEHQPVPLRGVVVQLEEPVVERVVQKRAVIGAHLGVREELARDRDDLVGAYAL
jgi:hypothetical protein